MTGVYHRAQVRKSTWKSYLADYRTATRYVGLGTERARIDTPRSEAWRTLLRARPRSERNFLSRFAGLMTQEGVEPQGVTEEHFVRYRRYLLEAAVRDPERAYDGACWAWGRVQSNFPELPRWSPPRAYRRTTFWRPWSDFPANLESEIDALYASWSKPVTVSVETLFQRPVVNTRGGTKSP